MQNSYTNKIVLVTRGTSGIGRATALAFVEAGPKVVITGRREKEGTNVAGEITKTGAHVHAFDYSGTRCHAGKISRRNHPRRRFVSHGCRNGSSSGLRNRAPGAQARRSRSGLYTARRTRPRCPTTIALASRSSRSCLLPRQLVPLLQSAPAGLSTSPS